MCLARNIWDYYFFRQTIHFWAKERRRREVLIKENEMKDTIPQVHNWNEKRLFENHFVWDIKY